METKPSSYQLTKESDKVPQFGKKSERNFFAVHFLSLSLLFLKKIPEIIVKCKLSKMELKAFRSA